MTWWCAASTEPWTWSPQAYVGVWLVMSATLLAYFRASRRAQADGRYTTTRKQKALFTAGVLVLWAASDWPLGTLGAGYMASAHMAQYVLYTVVAVPLILLGMPAEMFRRILAALRLKSVARFVSKPLIAAMTFNIIMVTTHSPPVTDALRAGQVGSFVMDVFWIIGAVALWLPVASPIVSQRMAGYPGRMIYLFLSVGIIVVVPSAALIISADPIYRTYELAPRVFTSWSAVEDQQFAGVIMKLGATPIVWGTILALFIKWTNDSGLSNKFGPKFRGRLVHSDGTVDAQPDLRSRSQHATSQPVTTSSGSGSGSVPEADPDSGVPALAGLRPEQLN